jgi:predicted regulator of Ras-like GTPase activity (Roadblock/LC7/MglB family)
VKEPEISLSLEDAAWRVPFRARYRYYSNPPTTVSLRLADLAAEIPEAARLPGFNAEKRVELSCEEIFTGPVPKLSLARLAELAEEDVGTEGLAESSIRLPVTRLALAFRFVNGRELIEEPPPPEPVRPERSSKDFAAKDEASKGEELAAERVATSPLAAAAPGAGETARNSPEDQIDAPEPSSALPGSLSQTSGEAAEAEESKPGEPETWRPITLFPIFRRKVVEPQVKPPVAPLRPVVESRAPLASSAGTDSPAQSPPETAKTSSAAPSNDSAPQVREAVLVEAERSHAPSRRIEVVDQDALQAVFMTEEMLSVDRVVELFGALPGIKSCVLAHGAAVLASYSVPESIDLVSLSAHALEMLAAMRQSAAQMGVGAVPAVTIHAEKGPITFFHQDDLCLLVMHKDRGFVPGVREKLQKVVEHLAQGDPALAPGDSRLPWAARKPVT